MNNKWFITEWKRAAVMLPDILKRAVLLVLVLGLAAGAAAFCVTVGKQTQNEHLMQVGYVAADNALTDMAVAYVQEMESVKALCSMERVSEEEGLVLLQEGELAALVMLPEKVVEGILSGQNTPVTIYLSAGNMPDNGELGNLKNLLFQELANSAVGMLETAQAEIYAVQYVLGDLFYSENDLVQQLYDDINRFNLGVAAGRESLFRTKSVSATENDTYVIYYGSALLTVYMLLAGLFFGGFFCHSKMWRTILEKRLNASRLWQVICGFFAGFLPMAVTGLLPFAALVLPSVREQFSVKPAFDVVGLMLFVMAFGVLYFMLIYRIFGEKKNALLAIGLLALIQAYLSGCIVPSALLPDLAYHVGKYLPASFLKSAFTMALSGDTQKFSSASLGLLVWSVVLFMLNVMWAYLEMLRYDDSAGGTKRKKFKTVFVPPVAWVLLKRMLFRKSILISLVLMAAVSVLIARLEKQSDTTFSVAVFDEGGAYEEQLLAHDGLVRFQMCESADEVERLVLRDEAECGYVLPETLTEDIMEGRANRSVTVYEDVDSVCVPIVNEVLFNVLFRHASLAWYQENMSEFCADFAQIERAFSGQIAEGKTFGIELVTVGEDGTVNTVSEENGTYPLVVVVVVTILLCCVQGFWTAIEDSKKGRFYKRGRIRLTVLTTILPMLAAAVLGGVLVGLL